MDMFSAPHFTNDEAARKLLEGIRWPHGPVCPHCGVVGHSYATKRAGVYRCAESECRNDFSVTTKSVMESSHIPLHKWMQGFYLMSASKKGISAHQLHRTLNITYKAAWFMAHRIREAMKAGGLVSPMGGSGKIVEADETYIGKIDTPRPRNPHSPPPTKTGRSGSAGKQIVVSLVERGGSVRSFHVAVGTKKVITDIVTANVARESRLHTDESLLYGDMRQHVASHETVIHSRREYARGDVTTNSVEGFFGIFKRGMRGTYQHCKEKHLHRYLAEFDFRYNNRIALGVNDEARTAKAIKGAADKRLTYRRTNETRV